MVFKLTAETKASPVACADDTEGFDFIDDSVLFPLGIRWSQTCQIQITTSRHGRSWADNHQVIYAF